MSVSKQSKYFVGLFKWVREHNNKKKTQGEISTTATTTTWTVRVVIANSLADSSQIDY